MDSLIITGVLLVNTGFLTWYHFVVKILERTKRKSSFRRLCMKHDYPESIRLSPPLPRLPLVSVMMSLLVEHLSCHVVS